MTKLITLFVITGLLALAEEPKPQTVPPPVTVDALKAEIAWLRVVIKELETKQKYVEIVCSQSDMMKAKQDVIDAAQKMQTQAAQQKSTTQ